MNIVLLIFLTLFSAVNSYGGETTSVGESRIETYDDSRRLVWISGDSAKELYTALKQRSNYTVVKDSLNNAFFIYDKNNFNDWACSEVVNSAWHLEYRCRTITIMSL